MTSHLCGRTTVTNVTKQGEQPPRGGGTAPLKRNRARAAAREKQLNEQK